MRNHRRAAYGERTGYEQMATRRCRSTTKPVRTHKLAAHAKRAWDRALALGEAHGYRNAQATVVAPTGTIGLVMDCDTTGIEPDFALVKFKKLAGGGYFKIINRAVPEALRVLGYSEARSPRSIAYAVGHGTLGQAPAINHATLKAKGFTDGDDRESGKGAADRLRHQVRLQQMDAGRRFPARHARRRGRGSRRAELRPACRISALPSARSRRPISMSAAP